MKQDNLQTDVNILQAQALAKQVTERSGQPIQLCYQCKRCAAGCPVADDTDGFTPDKLVRSLILGDLPTALHNKLIWRCVSCYTCGTRCPNGIGTGRITEILKQMCHEQGITPIKTKVDAFHRSFVDTAIHLGRVNELEFMLRFEIRYLWILLKNKEFAAALEELSTQAKLGRSMQRLKRLHIKFSTSKGRKVFRDLAGTAGKPA